MRSGGRKHVARGRNLLCNVSPVYSELGRAGQRVGFDVSLGGGGARVPREAADGGGGYIATVQTDVQGSGSEAVMRRDRRTRPSIPLSLI